MGMVVRTNTMAMNANRQLSMNNSQVAKSLEKLSSGFRINRAADDASGLAISEKMKAQIKGLEQASANSQDGISLIQTAEGGLTEVHNMLNRMVELATKSANGTIRDDVDREAIQTEVDALNTEITRISKATNFNGINLLDGSLGAGATGFSAAVSGSNLSFAAPEGYSLEIAFDDAAAADGKITGTLTGNAIKLTIKTQTTGKSYTQKDFNDALKKLGVDATITLDKDMAVAAGYNTSLAATPAAAPKKAAVTVGGIDFEATKAGNITSTVQVAHAAGVEGVTVDSTNGNIVLSLDSNKTYSKDAINRLLQNAGAGVKATNVGTIGVGGATALAGGTGLGKSGLTLQIGDTNDSFNKVTVSVDDMSASGIGTDGINVSDQDAAGDSIDVIKAAINKVSTNRANLGALQNRLEYTINNLDTTAENMNAANSRIRDTDMAKEMMNYTKMNILTQAAQAMLAQANQQPQAILQLLQ